MPGGAAGAVVVGVGEAARMMWTMPRPRHGTMVRELRCSGWAPGEEGVGQGYGRWRTDHDGREDEEADILSDDVKAPARGAGKKALRGELHSIDEEDEGHGAVENCVLRPDSAPMGGHI